MKYVSLKSELRNTSPKLESEIFDGFGKTQIPISLKKRKKFRYKPKLSPADLFSITEKSRQVFSSMSQPSSNNIIARERRQLDSKTFWSETLNSFFSGVASHRGSIRASCTAATGSNLAFEPSQFRN